MNTPALHHLDFNLLLDLDALLREGSVVGAARRLHLSPPAMSRRLTRLREAIGDPLFVPAGRGLAPTPRALALRERVQAVIEEVRGVFTPVDVDFANLQRTFTIRANDGFAGAWATRLSAALMQEAPGIAVHFVPRADRQIDALRNGSVDLDIGVPGTMDAEIHSEPLFEAGFVGVVRDSHPLARTDRAVSPADLVAWPHISPAQPSQSTGRLDTALQALGLRRRVALVAPGFQAALVMAATADYVAVMPEPFARWAGAHLRLHIFPLPVATLPVEVVQSWHVRQQADPVHQWLREHVRALCETAASPSA